MTRLQEIESAAFRLSDSERAQLATHLLDSLPSILHDDDDGVAEALRRDAEMDASPESRIGWDELKRRLGR